MRLILGVAVRYAMFFRDGPGEVRCANWHTPPPDGMPYCAQCGLVFATLRRPEPTALLRRWVEHFGLQEVPRDERRLLAISRAWLHVPHRGNQGLILGSELSIDDDERPTSAAYYHFVDDKEFVSGGFTSMGKVLELLTVLGLDDLSPRLYLLS